MSLVPLPTWMKLQKSHHETGVASGFCHLSFTPKSSWKVEEEQINQNTVLLDSFFPASERKKHVMYILYLIHDMSTVIYTIIWPASIFNWFATKKLQIIWWPQVISTKYPSHQGSCTARRSRRSLILEGLQKDQPAMSGSLCWRWIDTNCLENVCRQRTAGDIYVYILFSATVEQWMRKKSDWSRECLTSIQYHSIIIYKHILCSSLFFICTTLGAYIEVTKRCKEQFLRCLFRNPSMISQTSGLENGKAAVPRAQRSQFNWRMSPTHGTPMRPVGREVEKTGSPRNFLNQDVPSHLPAWWKRMFPTVNNCISIIAWNLYNMV